MLQWRTVQEANRFYETVKSTQANADDGMHSPRRFTLGGRLDEYGDIRSRPNRETASSEPRDMRNPHHGAGQPLSSPGPDGEGFFRDHGAVDFETDMFQWPFIDGSWAAGFDAGLDGLWHHSGLFDSNQSMR